MISETINVYDLEHDNGRIIEIGLTTVKQGKIIQTYSMPVLWDNYEVSEHISLLTGWTTSKLVKQGQRPGQICQRLFKYGFKNRIAVVDHSSDAGCLEQFYENTFADPVTLSTVDLSLLFYLFTGKPNNVGLVKMLEHYGLEFEGKQHRASDDSRNIARLFLAMFTK